MINCKVWLSYVNDVKVSTSLIGTHQMFGEIELTIEEVNGQYVHNIEGIVADEPYMNAVGYYIRMNTLMPNPIPIITPEEYKNNIQAELTRKYECWKDGGRYG